MRRPTSPQAYAEAVFVAWQSTDGPTLRDLAEPGAVETLSATAPPRAAWTGPTCEGAAGSSYCTWTSAGITLVLRVANEAAAHGEARAVTEARLTTR
jgi:hypothetical protein